MCAIINFNDYRFKSIKKGGNTMKKTGLMDRETGVSKNHAIRSLVSEEWIKEYISNGWGLMRLIYHIIEQYGYICCRNGKKYVFEEIKKDTRYYKMYPQIENKRLRAPIWVKVSGEWYFIEVITDTASWRSYMDKFAELGNYDVKGFIISMDSVKTQALKMLLDKNDIVNAAEMISDCYDRAIKEIRGTSGCSASVSFGCEKTVRKCTYRMLELGLHEYVILEGMELETGKKHLVLLCGNEKAEEYNKYYKKQYKNAGIPLLYGKWNPQKESWKTCISRLKKLNKRKMAGKGINRKEK